MWEISLNDQVITFLLAVLMGGIFGLIFDTVKAIRNALGLKTLGFFITDLLYFMVIAVIDFCFLLVRCNGEIRGYVLLAELAGFFLIRFTLSKFYFWLLEGIFTALSRVTNLINNIFWKITNPILAFGRKLKEKLKNFLKNRHFYRKKG